MKSNFVFLIISCMAFLSSSLSYAGTPKSLILRHKDPKKIEKFLKKLKAKSIKRARRYSAVVAELDEAQVKLLKKNIPDLKVSEDITVYIEKSRGEELSSADLAKKNKNKNKERVPWGIKAVGALGVHLISKGEGIRVCVLDTGVDRNHPDLKKNIVGGENFVGSDSANWEDDNGHGTHVSGTIAAKDNRIGVIGIAPKAEIFAVKAFDREGTGSLSAITDGIYACVSAGAHIINMSFQSSLSPYEDHPLRDAIQYARNQGVYLVAAAGNSGVSSSNYTPSGYPSVISVAAVNKKMHFPNWTNFGLGFDDYSAPGVNILSTWMNNKYKKIDGTSMAAPHVSGMIALMLSSNLIKIESIDLGESATVQGSGLIHAASKSKAETQKPQQNSKKKKRKKSKK